MVARRAGPEESLGAPGTVVLDMNDRRPAWAMPSWVPERLRAALPPKWTLDVVEEASDGSGDGAARVSDRVLGAVGPAVAYFGYGIAPELLRAGPGLRWVHSGAAGVGSSLTPELRASPVVFTNSAGIHGPPMAETVLAMILHFGRGLDHAVRAQARGEWNTEAFYGPGSAVGELSTRTVGIVGYGGVGREIARRLLALGAEVIALRRQKGPAGRPRPGEVEVLTGRDGFERLLGRSDVVVLSAPETYETRGMMDAAAFARMKPGSVLVNVARGGLVDTEALVDALRSGRVRGAGLDVFATEPLPVGHPLWSLPNVLLTPHVSAVTDGFWARQVGLIERNLDRFLKGTPADQWENVVDRRAGY